MIQVPVWEKKHSGIERVLKKLKAKNFPNLAKDKNIESLKEEQNKINKQIKKSTSWLIIIKLLKIKMQKEILKAGKEQWNTNINGSVLMIWISERRKWHIFQMLKVKNHQSQFLYQATMIWTWMFYQNLFVEILMPNVSVWESGNFGKLIRLILY